MERFEHKSYRADLYKKLKEKSSEPTAKENIVSERQKLYEDIQKKPQYIHSKNEHQKEIKNTRETYKPEAILLSHDIEKLDPDDYFANDGQYNGGLRDFTSLARKELKAKSIYKDKKISFSEDIFKSDFGNKPSKEVIQIYKILKESLKDSNMIDLGCGSYSSVKDAYNFCLNFGCKKYIGVDKYLGGEHRSFGSTKEKYDEVFKEKESFFSRYNYGSEVKLTQHELVKKDILEFLAKRTEQSNFMLNGLEAGYIIPVGDEGENYMEKVFYHIARLVPEGGIVMMQNTTHFDLLEKYGFSFLKHEQSLHDLYIFKKNSITHENKSSFLEKIKNSFKKNIP